MDIVFEDFNLDYDFLFIMSEFEKYSKKYNAIYKFS